MATEGMIDVPGGRVWYHDTGPGSGAPVLALHGGPGASSGYLAGLDVLPAGRRVVRYNQIGSSKSEYDLSEDLWRIERFVDELGAVRDALGLDRVHLYGHSWGTLLAVRYLLDGGAGIVSLTLVSPWFSTPRYLDDVRNLASRLPGEAPAIIEALAHDEAVTPQQMRVAVAAFYREYFCRDAEKLAALFQDGPPGPAYEAMWGPNEFHSTSPVLANLDITDRLGEVAVPTLLLCGEHDPCTPETTRWFQSLISGSEVVVLPDCSHMSILEDREAHLAAVADFLPRVEGSHRAPDEPDGGPQDGRS